MKSPLRLIARVVFLAVVLVLLAGGILLARFTSWRADKMAALDADSEVGRTNAGPVEFLVEGEGPAILVFHGAPGGYDQAKLLAAGLRDEGFQVIAPSRPGYLRTPLETGLLPMQQADAMAALLDELGVDKVRVLAFSEGAPAALFFARRHAQRTAALTLISPVTKRFNPFAAAETTGVEFGREILRGLTGDVGAWVAWEIAERDPRRGLEWLLRKTSTLTEDQRAAVVQAIAADPVQCDWYAGLMGSFNPLSPRETGARNDLLQIRALEDFPWAKMEVPALFVHGEKDLCVPLEDSRAAATAMPDAELMVVPDAGHVVQLGPQAGGVRKKLVEFFRQHAGGEAQP
jgi:Predicted hydrolases or acyltransferases (alpha/beta hydrolase superfamily)